MKCSTSVDSFVNLKLYTGEIGDEPGTKNFSKEVAGSTANVFNN